MTLSPVWFWGALHDRLAPTAPTRRGDPGRLVSAAGSPHGGWGVSGYRAAPSSLSLVPATPVHLYVGRADKRAQLHGEGG